MTPRSIIAHVDLTGTENAQFGVFASRFKLTDDQIAGECVRYCLALSGNSSPASAKSLREFFDQQINIQEAVSDRIRTALDRVEEGVRAHTIVAGLLTNRVAELPRPKVRE